MQPETIRHESCGVTVIGREIIVPGRTISVGDVWDVQIQKSGRSAVDWFLLGLLLVLAGAGPRCASRGVRGHLSRTARDRPGQDHSGQRAKVGAGAGLANYVAGTLNWIAVTVDGRLVGPVHQDAGH